jgi:hypothetical protein
MELMVEAILPFVTVVVRSLLLRQVVVAAAVLELRSRVVQEVQEALAPLAVTVAEVRLLQKVVMQGLARTEEQVEPQVLVVQLVLLVITLPQVAKVVMVVELVLLVVLR